MDPQGCAPSWHTGCCLRLAAWSWVPRHTGLVSSKAAAAASHGWCHPLVRISMNSWPGLPLEFIRIRDWIHSIYGWFSAAPLCNGTIMDHHYNYSRSLTDHWLWPSLTILTHREPQHFKSPTDVQIEGAQLGGRITDGARGAGRRCRQIMRF